MENSRTELAMSACYLNLFITRWLVMPEVCHQTVQQEKHAMLKTSFTEVAVWEELDRLGDLLARSTVSEMESTMRYSSPQQIGDSSTRGRRGVQAIFLGVIRLCAQESM